MRENSSAGFFGLPRRFWERVTNWDPVTIIGCTVITFILIVFTVMVLTSHSHKSYTIAASQIAATESPTTIPSQPEHMQGTEYLVTYLGRDLHCVAIKGQSVPFYMTCDWQRWHAEEGSPR